MRSSNQNLRMHRSVGRSDITSMRPEVLLLFSFPIIFCLRMRKFPKAESLTNGKIIREQCQVDARAYQAFNFSSFLNLKIFSPLMRNSLRYLFFEIRNPLRVQWYFQNPFLFLVGLPQMAYRLSAV